MSDLCARARLLPQVMGKLVIRRESPLKGVRKNIQGYLRRTYNMIPGFSKHLSPSYNVIVP